jgi:hypothetical protein
VIAAKRMFREHTIPQRVETDWGKGFTSAFTTRGRWAKKDAAWAETLFAIFACEVHKAPPRHAWHKKAESLFARLKEQDRGADFLVGGSPAEKPEDVDRRARLHMDQVPTLEEYRAQRERDFETYNRTPQQVLGGLSPNLYYEQHLDQVRRANPEMLDFAAARPVGKRKVYPSGVSYRNLDYGKWDEAVWRLQGQTVWLRADPEDASFVWLCRRDGTPLYMAARKELSGANPEHVKKMERHKAQLRKVAREYLAGREFLHKKPVQQLREVM